VDSSGQVSSSALISAHHLYNASPENAAVVKRWISEVQEATTSSNLMVQFHAMQLLYEIKSGDRLGVSKLVQQFSKRNSLNSPLAIVCLVRYTGKLLHDEVKDGRFTGSYQSSEPTSVSATGYQFLEASLKHGSDMVIYEAARAICTLPNAEAQDINPSITVLQSFITSTKPANRFAAMKILSQVSNVHPRLVAKCNDDLESLIGDSNRSIATLAMTTLLKTGSENSIDRLLKQISTFLTDIADEYKITIVRSLQKLCFTYPAKHRILVGFMSNFLREEGGFEFKKTIVTTIINLIRAVPETTESSLLHLCEFIEDCEFTTLSTQILHLLGDLGPTTSAPARYIRFIYNRVILENSAVRAAAVSALAKFAARCPSLRTSVMTLLRRSLMDEDDETRDRTTIVVTVLEHAMEQNPYVAPEEDDEADDIPADEPVEGDEAAFVLLETLPMSFDKLHRSLVAYQSQPGAMESSESIVLDTLPVLEDIPEDSRGLAHEDVDLIDDPTAVVAPKEVVDPAAALYAIPELASLGRVFRSSAPTPLTESETEYVVSCTKHVYEDHLVLQFNVENTIDDQRLENVTVMLESDSGVFEVTGEIPATGIKYGEMGTSYTVLKRQDDGPLETTEFASSLHFNVVQVDPATGEAESDSFEEEYPLEDLLISSADYMAKVTVPDFRKAWEVAGNANEQMNKYALQYKTLGDGVAAVIEMLGMQPCDGTGVVKTAPGVGGEDDTKPHMMHLSGTYIGGKSVLARAQMAKQGASQVLLKIAVRSEDPDVTQTVVDCIR